MTIKQKIKALANSKKVTLKETSIYTSQAMLDYLNGLAWSILRGKANVPKITICQKDTRAPAWTSGKILKISYASDISEFYTNTVSRFNLFLGLLLHELAHILYLHFDRVNEVFNSLAEGSMLWEEPTDLEDDDAVSYNELKAALSGEYNQAICKLYSDYYNICADAHDEDCLLNDYGKTAYPIYAAREALWDQVEPIEEYIAAVDTGKMDKLSVIHNVCLTYTRFGEVHYLDEAKWLKSEMFQLLSAVSKHLEAACWTDSVSKRCFHLTYLIIKMWPYIRDAISRSEQEQSNDGSGDDSDSGDGSSSALDSLMDKINAGSQNSPMTATPQDMTSSGTAKNMDNAADNGQQGARPVPKQAPQSNDTNVGDTLDNIVNAVATDNAIDQLESENIKAMQRFIRNIIDATSEHKNIPVDLHRVSPAEATEAALYKELAADLKLYSKKLQREMLQLKADTECGSVSRHKSFGSVICPEDAYRPDQKFFANKKNPDDFPEMAICVLVDNSGSMAGERIDAAMKAAILLQDFASATNIPISVCGHQAIWGNGIKYIVYMDYESYRVTDRYKLAKMDADHCNHDGAALEIAVAELKARPEKLKLLIIISDGQPNHDNYSGPSAEKDIAEIVVKAKRNGVDVIAAAIGDDKDIIHSIYGDSFLDITDLNLLPRKLVSLVKHKLGV